MSGTRGLRTRGAVALCGITVWAVAATGLTAGPALAADTTEIPDSVFVVATAAASGAGDAATQVIADSAQNGMTELGRLAVTIEIPAPKKSKASADVIPHPTWSWNGWQSGAAGVEAEDGTFATWRGEPLGVVAVWSDTSAEAQTALSAVGSYADYAGDLDVAVGGLVRGETWAQAASGAFVERWTTAMRNLRTMREGKGTTYVRIAHEMNGDWMAWGVNGANLAAYKAGYRLYASIVRKEFPEARLTWSPNGGNHTTVSIEQMYPGNDVVDVIGPDIYDGFPDVTTAALWKESSTMWTTPQSPRGLAAWQAYALRKGKPISLPEWGLPYGDHPEFIKGVFAVLSAHQAVKGSASNAGRFVYDCYFNVEDKFKIYNGPNTAAGAAYVKLNWGS